METMFGFGRLVLLVEPLYFVDPQPAPGQEGHERGVRVEVRVREPQPQRGSVYASQRIVVDRAVWRCDLLESVEGGPGSCDRMHHHPEMHDNEPGERVFDAGLSSDPVGWLGMQLAVPRRLLERSDVTADEGFDDDAAELLASLPAILEVV
ncbi:MAG: hypothetical protein ABI776_17490, partial [Nocardioidaceae bacterium]